MGSINLERLLSGRILALDRGSLANLTALAEAHRREDAIDLSQQRQAAIRNSVGALGQQSAGSVAVVPIVGTITTDAFLGWLLGGTDPDAVARAVREAARDPNISSILLYVDSSGGSS